MLCDYSSEALRTYNRRMFASLLLYAVFLVGAILAFRLLHPSGPVSVLIAILPALAILATIAALGRFLAEEKDEFQRSLMIQTLLWGSGGTLAITTVWGFLEMFKVAGHLEPFWIYPIFWAIAGVAKGLVPMRYR